MRAVRIHENGGAEVLRYEEVAFKKMRELLHPDYHYTGADGKEAHGPDAGIAIAQMYGSAFPDARFALGPVPVAGDTAVAEVIARGTHEEDLMGIAPTGKKVEIRICNIVEVRNGRCTGSGSTRTC